MSCLQFNVDKYIYKTANANAKVGLVFTKPRLAIINCTMFIHHLYTSPSKPNHAFGKLLRKYMYLQMQRSCGAKKSRWTWGRTHTLHPAFAQPWHHWAEAHRMTSNTLAGPHLQPQLLASTGFMWKNRPTLFRKPCKPSLLTIRGKSIETSKMWSWLVFFLNLLFLLSHKTGLDIFFSKWPRRCL